MTANTKWVQVMEQIKSTNGKDNVLLFKNWHLYNMSKISCEAAFPKYTLAQV
jgi:hypothetical protein